MAIQVKVEGLGTLSFPDDTPEDVISDAVRREVANQDAQNQQQRTEALSRAQSQGGMLAPFAGVQEPMSQEQQDRAERLRVLREMRGGGGPMSPEAEAKAIKGTLRYGVPLAAGIAAGPVTGLAALARTALIGGTAAGAGETGAETFEKFAEGQEYRPGQIFGATVRGAVPYLKGAGPLTTFAKNVTAAGTGGVAGGMLEGGVTDAPSALKEFVISGGLAGVPQTVESAAGAVGSFFRKAGEKAQVLEKAGITPLATDVVPGLASFAQRAQSKMGLNTLRKLEENQVAEIERRARELGGSVNPTDVVRVYEDAVQLLGLNKVNDITGQSRTFAGATEALQNAVNEAKKYGNELMQSEQQAFRETRTRELNDVEQNWLQFVDSLGTQTEQKIAGALNPRIAAQEARATREAFPAGVPTGADTARQGFRIQQLITQPAEGQPPGLKQLTDDFFKKEYASIPTEERVFRPDVPIGETGVSLIDKVQELRALIPKTGMPGLEDIIKGASRTERVPIAGTGGMASKAVPSNFSLSELREIRSDLENWAYSKEAYGSKAQAKAKELSNYITTLLNEQAPIVYKPEIAEKFLQTQAKYAQVRKLWENPYIERAFAGIEATPEKFLEQLGNSVTKYGTQGIQYRGISDLLDNLKAIGVEGVPDRSQINSLVQQFIATKAANAAGGIDNTKLLGILNGIERTAPGSLQELGFGNLAQLRNFDVVNNLIQSSTKNNAVDYRGLLTKLNVMESQSPGTLKALGLGPIDDLEKLNRKLGAAETELSEAVKARKAAESDTLTGYKISERILGLLEDSKDIKSVMNTLEDQVSNAATPELRKAAADALINTRATKIEDILFGARQKGVSPGAVDLDPNRIRKMLEIPSSREEFSNIVGPRVLKQIEDELLPAFDIIRDRQLRAGGAGQTTGGQIVERATLSGLKAPLVAAGTLATKGQFGTAALAGLVTYVADIGGTYLAAKVLARTVGATGLRSKQASAQAIESLARAVNNAPNRATALRLIRDFSETGEAPSNTRE
jgi:hypothetical protein